MNHDELAHDLAVFLSRRGEVMVWEDHSFWNPDSMKYGSGLSTESRPDVFAINNSPTPDKWEPTTYEVKVTRSDFLQDVKKGKWKKYTPYSARVVYAVVDGLVDASEIPKGAGLIVRKERGFGRKRDQPGWKWVINPLCTSYKLITDDWVSLCRVGRNLYPNEKENQ